MYSFKEVKDQVRDLVLRMKQNEAYNSWIANLRKEAYVQITL